jgi:hypothetical protein
LAKALADTRAAAEEGTTRSLAGTAPEGLAMQLALYASALADTGAFAYVYLGGPNAVAERNARAAIDRTALDDATRAGIEAVLADVARNLVDPLAAQALFTLPVARVEEACTFCPYTRLCPGFAERAS